MMKGNKSWQGSFEAETQEELVIKQIRHNCNFWGSDRCKRTTLEKYCREKGVVDPGVVIEDLILQGIVFTPKKGYVGIVEAVT